MFRFGQLAGTDFFGTRTRRKVPFSPRVILCGFALLRNGGNSIFEILGQAGVSAAVHPISAKLALGWEGAQTPSTLTSSHKPGEYTRCSCIALRDGGPSSGQCPEDRGDNRSRP